MQGFLYLNAFQAMQWELISSSWWLGVFEDIFGSDADERTTTVDLEILANPSCIQEDYTVLHTWRDALLDICSYVVDLCVIFFLMCVIEGNIFVVANVGVLGLFVHVQVTNNNMATHTEKATHTIKLHNSETIGTCQTHRNPEYPKVI